MLDWNKLSSQISVLSFKLFPDLSSENNLARDKWLEISNNSLFYHKALAARSSFLVPSWNGNLDDSFDIKNDIKGYTIFAVDGSQVYPDRNISGAGCFLINTGGCFIEYKDKSEVSLFSDPKVFLIQDIVEGLEKVGFNRDFVDLKREELEFEKLFTLSEEFVNKNGSEKFLSLVDGSLIFWHLEGKQQEIKDLFFENYIKYLNKFYEQKIFIAGYISFPKSRELVNLIKLGLCRFETAECISCHSSYNTFPCKKIDRLIDSQVVRFYLKPNQRTTIFWSKSKISKDYPEHLKPCFFYLNVGQEIARIETLAWVAQSSENLNLICKVILDQCEKGRGYPVVLAEAHEQAVVKGPDREFFYSLICKVGIEKQRRVFYSQKSLKKRGIAI